MAPHAAFLLPLLSLGTASALASMPTPQLHPQTLQPLFGAEQFVAVHNFLNPSLVSALATDVESLRQRGLANTKASTPAHGSVEWLMLQPKSTQRKGLCKPAARGKNGRYRADQV